MPLVKYAPAAALTAGMTTIGDAPAIADIHAPKVTELNASTVFQCATEAFGSTTNVSKTTRKMICDRTGTEKVGNRTYQLETLTVMYGNPQDANTFIDTLLLDSVHYFWVRPGKDDTTEVAVGDKVQIVKASIDATDLRPITTADGDEYAAVIQVSVQERTALLVDVVA